MRVVVLVALRLIELVAPLRAARYFGSTATCVSLSYWHHDVGFMVLVVQVGILWPASIVLIVVRVAPRRASLFVSGTATLGLH